MPSSIRSSPLFLLEEETWCHLLDFLGPSDVRSLWQVPNNNDEQHLFSWRKRFCGEHGTKLKVLVETVLLTTTPKAASDAAFLAATTTKKRICVACQLSACADRCGGCHLWEINGLLEECKLCHRKYCLHDPCDGVDGDENPYWHQAVCFEDGCDFEFGSCLKRDKVLCYEDDSDGIDCEAMVYPGCEDHPQLCDDCYGGSPYTCCECGKVEHSRFYYESHCYGTAPLCKRCTYTHPSHCFKKNVFTHHCYY